MGFDGGNFGMASSYKAQAATMRANARVARAQGGAAKSAKEGQAARMELENRVAGDQASLNQARMRGAAGRAAGELEAVRGASGLTAEGTGTLAQVSALTRFEQSAADMAYSRGLSDQGARFQAALVRKGGEFAEAGAEVEAQYDEGKARVQDMLAHNAEVAGWLSIGAGVGTAIAGGVLGGATMKNGKLVFGELGTGGGLAQGLMFGQGAASMFNRTLPGSAEAMGHGNAAAEKFFTQSMVEWLK